MAPERKKLFGCPSCGFRVTGTEDACPRCGAKFGREARFECPFCGEVVTPLTKECPSCHIAYDDFVSKAEERVTDESIDSLLTEIIEIESKKVKEEAKKLSCPKCSWMVDGTEDHCPRCGTTFMDMIAYQCPICASLVHYDAERCYECSAVFVMEAVDEGTREAVSVEGPAVEGEPETPVVAEEPPVEDEPERQTVPEEEPVRTPEAAPQEEAAQKVMAVEVSEPKEVVSAEEEVPAEERTEAPVVDAPEEPVAEDRPPVLEDRPPAAEKPTAPPKKVRRRKLKAKT